ncbi:MAG: hypothetical protein MJY95_03845 [Bacteroidaceae bacterium]|nr:hypothetical protein [Bacteroidaceae bacterium]
MKAYIAFPIIGIIISVAFIMMATPMYDSLNFDAAFLNDMYNSYTNTAVTIVCTAWIVAAIYYYVINSVRFSRWYHWLLMLIAAVIIAPGISFYSPYAEFSEEGKDYMQQLTTLNFVNVGVTIVMFIVASFSIRWWSTNCRHTPIPE